VIVPCQFFPLNPPSEPFKHPGAMATPYPDLRHFTTRDYGNRVGVFRLLRALSAAGLRATFAVDVHTARRAPPLIQAIDRDGHEIAAHGVSTAHIHHAGLSERDERDLVNTCREQFPQARTWMSPARHESFATPDLIRGAGFDICLDWEMDQRPLAMRTAAGPLTALPNPNELDDFHLLQVRAQSEEEWSRQIEEAARFLIRDYDRYGTGSLAFTLTPYVAGQPFRIGAVVDLLQTLAGIDGLEFMTAADTVTAFAEGEA
jgi:hypothetical protein